MLSQLVAQGLLPPVDERLPEEPLVIEPVEEIGQYGGTLNTFATQADHPGDGAYAGGGFETLLKLSRDLSTIIPNIVAAWEYNDDATALTLKLREGMKWSDGEPLDADDWMFWWNDQILDDDLTPRKPLAWWGPGGELMKVVKIDDYTVQWQFAAPYPVATMLITGPQGYSTVPKPEHYLKQFHIKYNEEAGDLAKEAGFEFWYQYYQDRASTWTNMSRTVGQPVFTPYLLEQKESNFFLYERNPYYWKVDTAGNQLPYIDQMTTTKVEDLEIYNAKIVSGEADFATRYSSIENYPLYKESEGKADYRVLLWPTGFGSQPLYQPNQTAKDPVLRQLFRDVRFRRALSMAINREEINETLFFGLGTPRQWTLIESSSIYEPKYGTAYADYDPDQANKLLDEMGLKWDADRKWRLRRDGERLAWTLDLVPTGPMMANSVPMSELIKEYWADIGVDISIKTVASELAQHLLSDTPVLCGRLLLHCCGIRWSGHA
jgi:peptide/nickel transport system substrate-binding protein